MNKRLRIYSIISFGLVLGGCSLFPNLYGDLAKQIDSWIIQHEYEQARYALENVRQNHPQQALLKQKKTKLRKAIDEFEKSTVHNVKTLTQQRQWQKAKQSIEFGLDKLPQSQPLQKAQQTLNQKREQHVFQLQCQRTINHASALTNNTAIYTELAQTLPENAQTQSEFAHHQASLQTTHKALVHCGMQAQDSNNLYLAEQSLVAAQTLQPDKTLQPTINAIQQQLAKQQKQRVRVLSKKGKRQLKQAQQKMASGKLKHAIVDYEKIPAKDKRHQHVQAFKTELNQRVKNHVSQGIEMGRKLYSQGEIKQALAIWHNIKELDPGNQYLISHIDRAQRVLDKLDTLQNEQSTITPPPTTQQDNNS